jgi:hypothetical protein
MKPQKPVGWIVVLAALSLVAAPLRAADEQPALPDTGMNIARGTGGWINIEAAENRLTLRFFDANKTPVTPDVDRGVVRVVYPAREDVRVVLNLEGDSLRSPPTVRPPWVFRIYVTLSRDGVPEAESYVVPYPEKQTP